MEIFGIIQEEIFAMTNEEYENDPLLSAPVSPLEGDDYDTLLNAASKLDISFCIPFKN